MPVRKIVFFIFICLMIAACRNSSADVPANQLPNSNSAAPETGQLPPFATKEPEKYSAKIVFASRFEETAANFIEQTYTVARDGANRRLDFQSGDTAFSKIQTADGKIFILSPKQKIYAELTTEATANFPSEISLENLLHIKPVGATFEKIGEEEILGRKTTKYRLDFGAVKGSENARSETFVWADENLGLPIKTEIAAIGNNQSTGAKNVVELREIKTDIAPEIFAVPKDYRKVSPPEIQQIFRK